MACSRFFAPRSASSAVGAESAGPRTLEAKVRALLLEVRARRSIRADAAPPSSNDDTCAVCLASPPETPATPDGCDPGSAHVFCLACLERWASVATLCPLCRRAFASASHPDPRTGGTVTRRFEEKRPVATANDSDDEDLALALALDDLVCRECGSGEDEHLTLLCDGCDDAVHLGCCDPPLLRVPEGDWFCDMCEEVVREDATEEESPENSPSNASPRRTRPSERAPFEAFRFTTSAR